MSDLSNLVYSSFQYWESEYLRKLMTFIKDNNKNEFDFLNQNINWLETNKTKRTDDKVLFEKLEYKDYSVDFFGNAEQKKIYISSELRRLKNKQEEKINKEDQLLKFLKLKRDRLSRVKSSLKIEENPYPKVFRTLNDFLIFKKFIDRHFVNPYKDLSYIFQSTKGNHGLLDTTHLKFAKFLLEKKIINENVFEIVVKRNGFEKQKSDERLNNYLSIKKEVENQLS